MITLNTKSLQKTTTLQETKPLQETTTLQKIKNLFSLVSEFLKKFLEKPNLFKSLDLSNLEIIKRDFVLLQNPSDDAYSEIENLVSNKSGLLIETESGQKFLVCKKQLSTGQHKFLILSETGHFFTKTKCSFSDSFAFGFCKNLKEAHDFIEVR